MTQYRKLWVDDARVLELARWPDVAHYALKATKIPIGVPYRAAGNGWGIVDLVPWDVVADSDRAGPDTGADEPEPARAEQEIELDEGGDDDG